MTPAKPLRLALGILLAALFIWMIARHVQFHDVAHSFRSADLRWIAAALAAFAIGYCCRIERWRLMLRQANPQLVWRACAGPFMGSFAANNVLPFRAGDLLRSFAFNERLGASSGVVIATLLAERLLDLIMVIALLAAALTFYDIGGESLATAAGTVLAVAVATTMLVLLFPGPSVAIIATIGRWIARLSPRMATRIADELEKSLSTLRHLIRRDTLSLLLCWSILAWIAEGCVYWFAALALPSIAVPIGGWIALPVGTLATLIPSTPGYVGTFDYFTVRAMTTMGNAAEATTAYALLVHALLWLPPTLVGGLYLLVRK